MLGFTRCASTSCFTQASEFISGVPLCPEHLVALEEHFTPSPPSVPTPATTKRVRERKPGEVRITSRVSLTPYQASVDPATALDLGCVYYLTSRRNAEAVKIGTTSRARRRFQSLSASAGERLRFLVAEPGGLEQEQYR
ncbi:GIY-YIG nuclease family protein, partial [Streptomyces hydrogenans]|uniref:GIY-YIG nuclease family protein n=1 Tax=Streptomyces hydrogenans TaxID=1873719 RepID=UPI00365BD7AE